MLVNDVAGNTKTEKKVGEIAIGMPDSSDTGNSCIEITLSYSSKARAIAIGTTELCKDRIVSIVSWVKRLLAKVFTCLGKYILCLH